jgi:hypothetical protein
MFKEKPTIITQLLGGLGNQMFQYAAGRRVAIEHGLELLVDTSILMDHSQGRHDVNRDYGLDIFRLEVNMASAMQRWAFNAHALPMTTKVLQRLARPLVADRYFKEQQFRYDPALASRQTVPRYLSGLWQSYKYFEPISQCLRDDFIFRESLPQAGAALVHELGLPSSVVLNVRRGDYVGEGAAAYTIGFIGLEYYKAADLFLRSKGIKNPRYFVFSDDIEWCRENLAWLGKDAFFVQHELAGPKFSYYLQLMTLGSNFVIPNSTFAWWAAWLSKNEEKTVIAPYRWMIDAKIDTSDLCPPEWILL